MRLTYLFLVVSQNQIVSINIVNLLLKRTLLLFEIVDELVKHRVQLTKRHFLTSSFFYHLEVSRNKQINSINFKKAEILVDFLLLLCHKILTGAVEVVDDGARDVAGAEIIQII